MKDLTEFGSFSLNVIGGNHDMSDLFNGLTTFSYLQGRNQEKTKEHRMDWLINNYFSNDEQDERKHYEEYYKNSVKDIFDGWTVQSVQSKHGVQSKHDKHDITMDNIGSLYNAFTEIYKREERNVTDNAGTSDDQEYLDDDAGYYTDAWDDEYAERDDDYEDDYSDGEY